MKAYWVCVYEKIDNPEKLKEYAVKARPAVEKFSGKFGIRLNDTPFEQEERIHNQKLPAVKYFVRKNNIDKGIL